MAITHDTPAGLTSAPTPDAPSSGVAPGLLDRVKNILLAPKVEWPVIASEPTTAAQLYTGYVMPLAAFAAVIALIHMSIVGISLPFSGAVRMPFTDGLMTAVMTFAFGLIGLFLVALIINGLASFFGGMRDQRQALKVAAYAFTPAWVASVFALLPALSTLLQLAAGIYGIYLLALGLPVLMRSPKDRAFGYTATVVLSTILLGVFFGIVSTAFGGLAHMSPYGAFGHRSAQDEITARERGATMVGNMIGGALGTDAQGKAGLGKALANMAQVGQQMEQQATGSVPAGNTGLAGGTSPSGGAGSAGGTGGAAMSANGGSVQSAGAATSAGAGATTAGAMSGAQTSSAAQAGSGTQAGSAVTTGANTTATPADAASAAAGFIGALGGALGGNHRVEPVDFRELKAMLPDALPGMSRSGAEGSNQQAAGVKTSSATAHYTGPGKERIEVKIADVSGVSGLLAMASSLGAQTTDSESDAGFERDKTIAGRQLHEKFVNANKHGEVAIIVAQRFEVDVTGEGVDMSTLEQTAARIDLARLEAMKNQGAQSN